MASTDASLVEMNDTDNGTEEELCSRISGLLKHKSWITNQLLEHHTALNAQETNDEDQGGKEEDIENLLERITILQQELRDVATMVSVRDLAVDSAQMGETLVKHLFPPRTDDESGSGDMPQPEPDKELLELIQQQERLSTEILEDQQAIQETQPRLDKLRKENLRLRGVNRELMAQLEAAKEEQQTHLSLSQRHENLASAQERREQLVAKLEVLRGVFRRLVIGSGINWAADPTLTAQLIELGTPIETVIAESSTERG